MDRVDFTALTIYDFLILIVGGIRTLPRAVAFCQLGFSPVIVLRKYSESIWRETIQHSWYFSSVSLQSIG